MGCDKYKSILLDSGLSADDRRKLKEALLHIDSCAGCKEAVENYDSLREFMTGEKEVPEPQDEIDFCKLFQKQPDAPSAKVKPLNILAHVLPFAACVLIAFGLGILLSKEAPLNKPATGPNIVKPVKASSKLAFTSQEIKDTALAFKQLNTVYEGQAGWLMTAGKNSDIGLEEKTQTQGSKLILLRLSLKHSDRELSNMDIAIVPGQTAKMSIPLDSGHKLSYRIFAKDNSGQLGIYAKIIGKNGTSMPLAAIATRLKMSQGEVVSAGKLITNSGNYELDVAYSSVAIGNE